MLEGLGEVDDLHLLFQSPKIQVWLMDGTYRMLNLVSGANTTVQQLHAQMVTVSTPPVNYHLKNLTSTLFTVNTDFTANQRPIFLKLLQNRSKLVHLQDRNLKNIVLEAQLTCQ